MTPSTNPLAALPARRRAALLLAVLVLTTAWSAGAGTRSDSPARNYFTDVELVTHDGQKVRLYSDLLHDKVVVINAFFTTCAGVCPVTAANLQKIQKWLGPRLGEDVFLLSLTVDPEVDDLSELGKYAARMKARPGWYFLTGEEENLGLALRKLGLHTDDKAAHSPVFLVGNVRTGLWKKALGMAPSSELIEILESVLEDRLETAAAGPPRSQP